MLCNTNTINNNFWLKTYEEKTKNVKIFSWEDCANKTWKELGSI